PPITAPAAKAPKGQPHHRTFSTFPGVARLIASASVTGAADAPTASDARLAAIRIVGTDLRTAFDIRVLHVSTKMGVASNRMILQNCGGVDKIWSIRGARLLQICQRG